MNGQPRPQSKGLAVVTGASSGLGAEFARQLAARGYDLLLIARRKERMDTLGQELQAKHGTAVHVLAMDLAQPDAVDRARAEVARIGLPLKWLINNAGYGVLSAFEERTLEQHRRDVQIMAMAPIEFTHALLPDLKRAQPARIINVASLAGYLPGIPGSVLYGPVKAMLIRFTDLLAHEMKMLGTQVSVTVSCPGMTETEILDHQPEVDMDVYKRTKFMTATTVVQQAIAAADAGRWVVVHGSHNKFAAFLATHLPALMRRMMLPAVRTNLRLAK